MVVCDTHVNCVNVLQVVRVKVIIIISCGVIITISCEVERG